MAKEVRLGWIQKHGEGRFASHTTRYFTVEGEGASALLAYWAPGSGESGKQAVTAGVPLATQGFKRKGEIVLTDVSELRDGATDVSGALLELVTPKVPVKKM